ncbi:MAG: SDR family oxidoreductase [Rhodospirillaceae bacterium]|nr:SDR family oxidoreductase [Rhodospirillaceae bacterium]
MPAALQADFSGKAVLITGAGRGLGRAYAEAFAQARAAVAVNDLDAAAAEEVAGALRQAGARAAAVPGDIADAGAVEAMVAATRRAFGGLDILVNNAALYAGIPRRRFDKIPVEEWRRLIDVNVTGSFLCARAALPAMLENKWGRIINVSSSTVPLGRPGFAHYVASKAAILGMTRSMARDLGAEGVTVNAVMPGLTETEGSDGTSEAIWEVVMRGQAIPRREQPQDVVGAVLFLASDAAAFITGQTICVDGGSAHV